jgi:hypothetical protein
MTLTRFLADLMFGKRNTSLPIFHTRGYDNTICGKMQVFFHMGAQSVGQKKVFD